MKANVPQLGELVLLYGLEETQERGRALRQLLAGLKVPVKTVTADMLGQTVGWCAQFPGFARKEDAGAAQKPEAGEAMVLSGMTRKRLDQLLLAMRDKGINVPLKAMVTAHNMSWTFGELLTELQRERDAIRAQAKK